MTSIITRLTTATTDTARLKTYRDPVLNAGSLALFDFLDPYCNPNADGNIANGAVFKNLVPGGADATASVTNAGFIANAAGKAGLVFSGAGSGTANLINMGTSAAYNMSVSQHEFIFSIWEKDPASGYSTGQNSYAGKGTGGTSYQYNLNTGNGGIAEAITTGANPKDNASSVGAPRHLAVHWKNGQQRIYVNNVLKNTTSSVTALADYAASPLSLGNSYIKATIYRMLLEDIAVSGADPAAQIAADYARGVSRFV